MFDYEIHNYELYIAMRDKDLNQVHKLLDTDFIKNHELSLHIACKLISMEIPDDIYKLWLANLIDWSVRGNFNPCIPAYTKQCKLMDINQIIWQHTIPEITCPDDIYEFWNILKI